MMAASSGRVAQRLCEDEPELLAALGRRLAQLREVVVAERAQCAAESAVDLGLGQRAFQRLEELVPQLEDVSGKPPPKKVASTFSYCDEPGRM